ncbi:MAG: hypothetical protein IJ130_06985, partial [Solobacterium sp.]|nr:hypothetical protein [Solobacterium sp.]
AWPAPMTSVSIFSTDIVRPCRSSRAPPRGTRHGTGLMGGSIPEKYEIPEQKYPVRLFYMYMNQCCTIIDVNESERIVKIKNYTPYPMYRAFGTIDSPTFEEYETFLESRCFPRERDKMKLQLEEIGLPFYDPFMIIEKTEGRMAEDHFWIRIVRKHHD